MTSIFFQIFMIIMLVFIIKDIIKSERYKGWFIPIYAIVLGCELHDFNKLLKISNNPMLFILSVVTIISLGSLGYLMIKFRKNIKW